MYSDERGQERWWAGGRERWRELWSHYKVITKKKGQVAVTTAIKYRGDRERLGGRERERERKRHISYKTLTGKETERETDSERCR